MAVSLPAFRNALATLQDMLTHRGMQDFLLLNAAMMLRYRKDKTMVSKNKKSAAATTANVGSNEPAMDIQHTAAAMVAQFEAAALHHDKAEQCSASAAFTLANFIRLDGMSDVPEMAQTTASPDVFFSSEEARKVWYSPEMLQLFFGKNSEVKNGTWRNTVERAFSIIAFHNYLTRLNVILNPKRRDGEAAEYLAIDWRRQTLPALAWVQTHQDWKHLSHDDKGQAAVCTFGTAMQYVFGYDASRKGKNKAVSVAFIPSMSKFCKARAAWLVNGETRKTRNAKKDGGKQDGIATLKDVVATTADMLAHADYRVAGEVSDSFHDMLVAFRDASEANRAWLLEIATGKSEEAESGKKAA